MKNSKKPTSQVQKSCNARTVAKAAVLLRNKDETLDDKRHSCASGVAQVANLLFRRLPACGRSTPYVYFVHALVSREITFLVSPDAAAQFEHWDADWSKVSPAYKNEMQARVKKASGASG